MNQENYILFEKYSTNKLSAEEKLDFENQLKSDENLAESFKIYAETTAFLQHKFSKETVNFKQNLKTIAQRKKSKVISFQPWTYAVAASVVLFFGLWFMQGGNPEYGDYSQHEIASFTERGEVQNELKLAQEAFNQKKYKEAIANFEIFLKQDKRPEVEYFYAISLLEENQFNKAETIFNQLHSGVSIYKEKALWYLALTQLKQEKFEECKLILKKISPDSEDYDKAQKLLSELD